MGFILPSVLAAPATNVKIQCTGDGKTTTRSQLTVTNPTDKPVTYQLEPGTVLRHEGRQDLVVVSGRTISLPPKGAAKATVTTLCAGKRADSPATPEAAIYDVVPPGQVPAAAQALRMHECASKLYKEDSFPALPIGPALRVDTIAQLAFWAENGDMTKEKLKEETLAQLDLTEKNLEPEQEKEVTKGVDNIWDAVDLTCKAAKESQ